VQFLDRSEYQDLALLNGQLTDMPEDVGQLKAIRLRRAHRNLQDPGTILVRVDRYAPSLAFRECP